MLDFTSALYLGMRHPSRSLRPWPSLTAGVPAALAEDPETRRVAQEIAVLQGCERGVAGASTLHLFWDLFGIMAGPSVRIYVDSGAYPIARWGVERAAGRGAAVCGFRHHDAGVLRRQLHRDRNCGGEAIVVSDTFCPACGRAAPLKDYRDCARSCGGTLILDDTQALGIFGPSPGRAAPYGTGGRGMLAAAGIAGDGVLAVSSLAKGFGAPVAVLAGSASAIAEFERKSQTRTHCSPPSAAAVHAAAHALAVNRSSGDALRLRLAGLVARFRAGATRAGFRFRGGIFPVQTLGPAPAGEIIALHRRLGELGVRAVPLWARPAAAARLSFLITARHEPRDVDRAVEALAQAGRGRPTRQVDGYERSFRF
jgi:8-amino-7-oxononanoate synthase